jgi:N-acetylglutamate synthase-like GNAT family acetyltransferase
MPFSLSLHPIMQADRNAVQAFLQAQWGTSHLFTHGRILKVEQLPGFFICNGENELRGLITLEYQKHTCEIVTLNSCQEGIGIGSSLLAAAIDDAERRNCTRVFLCITNDNIRAFQFYQKRGFRLVAIHRGELDRVRESNTSIPKVGQRGIPLHDEIEFERILQIRRIDCVFTGDLRNDARLPKHGYKVGDVIGH